jgi:hypothetical protein
MVGPQFLKQTKQNLFLFLLYSVLESKNPILNDATVQRWRTITVDAFFKMNDGIEDMLNNQIQTSVIELDNTLMIAYPRSKKTSLSCLLDSEGQQHLAEIYKQARSLSYVIQHDYISCRGIVASL